MPVSKLPFAYLGKLRSLLITNDICSIALFPAGTIEVASSRLRLHSILRLMDCHQEVHGPDNLVGKQDISIAWFQKKLTFSHLEAAKRLKLLGATIIYDCDESGKALNFWAHPELVFKMLHLADYIIADTPERLAWLKTSLSKAQYCLLENEIDYVDPGFAGSPAVLTNDTNTLRVLWYGNSCNLHSIKNMLQPFVNNSKYQLVLCGANQVETEKHLKGVQPELHQWSREHFLDVLHTCDMTLLSHFGATSDRRKSAHKMITSICHGVPAIVSNTPDYARVAAYAKVQDFVFSDSSDLERVLALSMNPEQRLNYISRAQPLLLSKYYPGSFSAAARNLLEKSFGHRDQACMRLFQSILQRPAVRALEKIYTGIGRYYWRRMQS